jgi:hypothetical protein
MKKAHYCFVFIYLFIPLFYLAGLAEQGAEEF